MTCNSTAGVFICFDQEQKKTHPAVTGELISLIGDCQELKLKLESVICPTFLWDGVSTLNVLLHFGCQDVIGPYPSVFLDK